MDAQTTKSKTHEWRHGWVIVMSAFFIEFLADGLLYSFGILLVEIVHYFGEGRAVTGGIVSVLMATKHLIGPIVGVLADRYGTRLIIAIGAVLSAVGIALSSFATNVYHLLIGYGLFGGLGLGLMVMPSHVRVLQHFDKHLTLANGITVCGSGTGTFVFNFCLRFLIDEYGWRGTLLLEAGFVLQAVILGFLLSARSKKHSTPDVEKRSLSSNVKHVCISVLKTELLKDVKFMMYLLSTLTISLAFPIPFTYTADQVKHLGMSNAETSIVTSSIGIANIVSRVIVGWIGDRLCFSRLRLLEVTILLIGVLTGLSPLMNVFETKLLYTSLFGFLVGGFVTLLSVVIVDMVGEELIMNAFGLLQLSIGIGASAGTAIAGLLFDVTGSYNITFIVCGAIFVIGGLFLNMYKLFRTKKVIGYDKGVYQTVETKEQTYIEQL